MKEEEEEKNMVKSEQQKGLSLDVVNKSLLHRLHISFICIAIVSLCIRNALNIHKPIYM